MNKTQCENQTYNDQINTMMENTQPSPCPGPCKGSCQGSCPVQSCGETDQCQTPGCTCYLAIANIPMQEWNGTYPVEKAFMQGTIFPELDLPFCGRRIRR